MLSLSSMHYQILMGKLNFTSQIMPLEHTIIFKSKSWIEVPVKTIRTMMKELGLRKIDVLKIDAEGAELSILKGAGEMISNIRQIVCAAYHTRSEANEIEDYLSNKNFKTLQLSRARFVFAVAE